MSGRAGSPEALGWPYGQTAWTQVVELPGDFTSAGLNVGDACEGEEQVGQAIEVDHHQRRDLDLPLETDHPSLGAATDGAGDVEHRTLAAAARDDERLEGLELLVALVDGVLEGLDPALVDVRLGE